MGWEFCSSWKTKSDVVNYVLENYVSSITVIDHKVVGNHLWVLLEDDEGENRISLALLKTHQKEWGFKGISEESHPFYYDCPLSLIDRASEPAPSDDAAAWREKVREFHRGKSPAVKSDLKKEGDVVELYETRFILIENLGRRGWVADEVLTRRRYRLKSLQMKEAKAVATDNSGAGDGED